MRATAFTNRVLLATVKMPNLVRNSRKDLLSVKCQVSVGGTEKDLPLVKTVSAMPCVQNITRNQSRSSTRASLLDTRSGSLHRPWEKEGTPQLEIQQVTLCSNINLCSLNNSVNLYKHLISVKSSVDCLHSLIYFMPHLTLFICDGLQTI